MSSPTVSDAKIEAVAKAICAADYVNGPRLWEPESIERRWAEQDPERVQYYVALAQASVAAFVGS